MSNTQLESGRNSFPVYLCSNIADFFRRLERIAQVSWMWNLFYQLKRSHPSIWWLSYLDCMARGFQMNWLNFVLSDYFPLSSSFSEYLIWWFFLLPIPFLLPLWLTSLIVVPHPCLSSPQQPQFIRAPNLIAWPNVGARVQEHHHSI